VAGMMKLLKAIIRENELESYYYVTLNRWGRLYDVEELSQELQKKFTLVKTLFPLNYGVPLFSELWGCVPEILFKADTLFVAISPSRATLFQKKRIPFTPKDLELRKTILELYPSNLGPFIFNNEPKFKIRRELFNK